MLNPGVVAAIRVVGVRGDPCGAMQRIASHQLLNDSTTFEWGGDQGF